ncbi:hypothetical protein M378DRAFT_173094 [Amanita muscaria Koide BX008]|uniref:Yeast cell wall synthesis Kre9/Knh1-like N-terminal domain-containing protein n=1 Tax=Amanita muscaria (strain Koide BX008) TaxID=946122 RepID=A0A0C2W4E7_AMAMK|nr:hypothetical protein M378DRAFT_173094 [Amanita muscaria Koide BX008]
MIFNTSRALLLALASALVANAAIYVTEPSAGSSCHGGQTCSISWLDDGQAPLLSSIGVTRVALYTGELQLVQTLQPVDVSSAHTLTFTPDPKAGPNSGSYYIAFIPASDSAYRGYSPWFSLDNMSGSFASPDPAATSSLPLPSTSGIPTGNETTTAETTVSQSGSSSISATLTETSATSGATEATSSGFSTVRATSSGSISGASSGASSSATSSGTSTRTSASSTASASNAAVSNNVPATGFAATLLAFLGAMLL